jgi:bloom syndrome protein
MRRMVAEGLQEELSNFCREDIMLKNKLRQQPFSDTILRQIAIVLPTTTQEMMNIPNINIDMVSRYGDRLIRLIRNSKQTYKSMKDSTQRPHDPNHELIVDLTGDAEAGKSENEYEEYTDDEYADESSRHFQNDSGPVVRNTGSYDSPQNDSALSRFNSIMQATKNQTAQVPTQSEARESYKGKKNYNKKFRKARTPSGDRRKSGGTSKSAARNKAQPRNTGGGSGFAGGRSGGGGIRPMD